MAFGIGINNENQDAGMIRGSQQDIACECWFTQKGKIIPLMIKVQDEDGEIRCMLRLSEAKRIYMMNYFLKSQNPMIVSRWKQVMEQACLL